MGDVEIVEGQIWRNRQRPTTQVDVVYVGLGGGSIDIRYRDSDRVVGIGTRTFRAKYELVEG